MPKIRVDAEPLILYPEDIRRGKDGLFVESAKPIAMPLFKGDKVDLAERMTNELSQPVRLRCNSKDKTQYHLRLTRFNDFTVMVPVILAETDELMEGGAVP